MVKGTALQTAREHALTTTAAAITVRFSTQSAQKTWLPETEDGITGGGRG